MSTILITNDDGIHSPGLQTLKKALLPLGRVVIVAPDRDNSAISHALTMNRPLRLTELGEDVYTLDGTPTDCVAVALGKLFDHPPDLLVSGINNGPNIGDDISYSGTVSAAIEGTMYAVDSIAVSMAGDAPIDFSPAEPIIRNLAATVIKNGLPANTLMNVNIPANREFKGIKVTRQGRRIWKQALHEVRDPRGRVYYWIGGGTPLLDSGPDTDVQAIGEGYVSISPIHLDLTNHEGIILFKEDLQLEKIPH
jgi:5'-nucleotidase